MIALASINNLLVHKGLRSIDDIDTALQKAEASVRGDERKCEDMSPTNRDAICSAQGEADIPSFSELAKMVGQTKEPDSDQM